MFLPSEWMSPFTVPDHDLARGRGLRPSGQERLEDVHAGLPGLGGQHHLGEKGIAAAEHLADFADAGDEAVVHQPLGLDAGVDTLAHERGDAVVVGAGEGGEDVSEHPS